MSSSFSVWVVAGAVLGLLVGSFLNVVVHRLPLMLYRNWEQQARDYLGQPQGETPAPFNLLWPASRCPSCGHRIRAWENIPVISWLCLRGRCASCHAPIGIRYPLVELFSGLLSAVVVWQLGGTWTAAAFLVLTWALLALSLIDLEHQLLPDDMVLPLLWLGLLLNAQGLLFSTLEAAVWGAALGYLSLWSVFWLFKLVRGKEGMGYGDFKLLALVGAWGGWQVLPLTILLAAGVGAVLGSALLWFRGAEKDTPIPFGPYLATAGWIALLWGDELTARYLQFASF